MRKIFLLGFLCLCLLSCNTQKEYVFYNPHRSRSFYALQIPYNYRLTVAQGGNDYCYLFSYFNQDSSSSVIYIYENPVGVSISFSGVLIGKLIYDYYGKEIYKSYLNEGGDSPYDFESATPFNIVKPNPNHLSVIALDSESSKNFIQTPKKDTVIIGGNDGCYAWKEINIGDSIAIGYFNIPIKKEKLFDRCLKSLIYVQDSSMIKTDRSFKIKRNLK